MAHTYRYDGQFDGLLCVALEAARRGDPAPLVVTPGSAEGNALFGETVRVETCPQTARRVARALREKGSDALVEKLRRIHRADHEGADRALVRLIPRLARQGPDVFGDYGCDAAVLAVRLHRAVCREIHRMHAFVRFEAQGDGAWAARVEPLHDVLPFIGAHFASRYPQMRWSIFDSRRGYAIAYAPSPEGGRGRVLEVRKASPEAPTPGVPSPDEAEQQRRWRAYLRAVNIPARANPRLQRQHVPLRYRPLLSEFEE